MFSLTGPKGISSFFLFLKKAIPVKVSLPLISFISSKSVFMASLEIFSSLVNSSLSLSVDALMTKKKLF